MRSRTWLNESLACGQAPPATGVGATKRGAGEAVARPILRGKSQTDGGGKGKLPLSTHLR